MGNVSHQEAPNVSLSHYWLDYLVKVLLVLRIVVARHLMKLHCAYIEYGKKRW